MAKPSALHVLALWSRTCILVLVIGVAFVDFVSAQTATITQLRSSKNPAAAGDVIQLTASVLPQQGLNIDFPFGIGVSTGGGVFVRYDLVGATFGTQVVGSNFSNFTNPGSISAVVVVNGGGTGESYVIFQFTSASGVSPTDTARFAVSGLVSSSGTSSVRYSVHDNLLSAIGATPSNSALLTSAGPTAISTFAPTALTVGTVDFFSGAAPITGCSGLSLAGGNASCGITFGSIGSYAITALYSGTASFLSSSASLTQTIGFGLLPALLPNGTVGTRYDLSLTASGGTAPYSFQVASGTLPDGVTFGADGKFSGTPLSAGLYALSIRVTDSVAVSTTYDLSLRTLKGAQTITFSTVVTGRVGSSIALTATTTSGLPVSYEVNTPSVCVFTGTRLNLVSTGQCNVVASQSGDANYFAAASVTASINVSLGGAQSLVIRSSTGSTLEGSLQGANLVFSNAADLGTAFLPLAVVDLDGNGARDLVYRNVTSGDVTEVRFWRDSNNNLDTGLRNVRTLWRLETFGDLDGDGKGDLVWRFTGQTANADDTGVSYVWFTDGNGVTQVRKRGGAPLSWTLAGAVDINRDRAADMIYIASDNSIRVLMATANRTCANFQAGSLLSGYTVMKVGDFTGNRFGELFVRDLSTGQNRIIVLDGTGIALPQAGGDPDNPNASCTSGGQFVPTVVRGFFSADVTFQFFASVDLNGDGILDIIWMKPNRTLQIWLMARDGGIPQVLDNVGPVPAGFSAVPQ